MKRLFSISIFVLISITALAQIDTIQNNEQGWSVRQKLNAVIVAVNNFTGGTVSADSSFYETFTNKITELTSGSGVTIDGTKIQDYSIIPNSGQPGQYITSDADELSLVAGGSEVLDLKAASINPVVSIIPQTTDIIDLGSSTLFWDEFFGLFFRFKEQTAPAAPPADRGVMYMSSADEHIYFRSSAGTFDLTTGTGGDFDTTYLHYRIDSLITELNDTILLSELVTVKSEAIPLIIFGGGNALAASSAAFTTGAIYGSYYNNSQDTLVITSMRVILAGTSPSVAVQISWHATHQSVLATTLNSSAYTATSTTTGNEDTSFANTEIPPGRWVWCTTPTVTTAPTYMIVQLTGYKK